MMSCTTVGHNIIFLEKVQYCHNFYTTMTIAERSSKTYFIFVTATGFDRKWNEYIHIQAAHVHALLMRSPSRAGTKSKVLTSSTYDLKRVMSNL